MRQTNVRGTLSLRGFRKLRTGAIVATGVILLGLGFLAPTVSANEQDGVWVARTVAEVKADIQNIDNLSHYTIKWGDTLSAISGATGLSVDSLVEINRIANRDLIFANNKLYFSEEVFLKDENTEVKRQQVSIDNSGSCQSYEVETKTDTVTGEQTTTVKQTTPVVVETPAVSAAKSETPVTVAPKAETRSETLNAPSTESNPVTDKVSSNIGTTNQPVASNPSSEVLAPSVSAPKAEEPTASAPKAEEPAVSAPKADEPVASAPKVEEPAATTPKAEEPSAPAPKVEEPSAPAPKAEEPTTPAPTQPASTSEGTSSFRNAPSVQARARRVARSTSEPDGTVNISYNFAGMPDIHGFLSDPGENNTVTIPAGTNEEQAKELVKEKIQAKIKDLATRGYHVKNDIIFEQDTTVKNYNYVVTFTKEATGTSGFRMAPAVQPRASRNRRSLEQSAPQKVKVNVFYNFDQMKDIAGFLGDINGTPLEVAEGSTNEQVKASVKSQVDAKKEELRKRGYTLKEDYVYQANGKDYNYILTFSKTK